MIVNVYWADADSFSAVCFVTLSQIVAKIVEARLEYILSDCHVINHVTETVDDLLLRCRLTLLKYVDKAVRCVRSACDELCKVLYFVFENGSLPEVL